MSDFPGEWASVSLGSLEDRDLLSIRNGFSCGDHSSDPSGLAHLRPFNVTEDCRLSFGQMKFIPVRTDIDEFTLRSGDVLYNNTNSEELVGKCAYWPGKPGNFVLSNHMTILRLAPESGLDPRFLTYYLFWFWRSGEARTLCRRHVNQASIGLERLRQIDAPLPPVEAQEQIVRVLSNLQSSFEVELTTCDKLAALKSATMAKLFREGLRGEPLKQTEIGEIPESWEVARLGDIARIGNGSTPKRTNEAYWKDGHIPWITSTKIHDVVITGADEFVTEDALRECHLPMVPRKSLVVAITGQGKTLGNVALLEIDTCINQHLAYVQFQNPSARPEFYLFFLQSLYPFFRQVSSAGGSTKGALTCGLIANLKVPFPSREEQQQIAELLLLLTRRHMIATKRSEALSTLFGAALTQLMTGGIRIKDLDVAEVSHA